MNPRLGAVVLIGFAVTTLSALSAQAFTSTSTTFFVRQGIQSISGANSVYSFATSTAFKLISGDGQTAPGTSTSASYGIRAGFLRTLYASSSPQYVQSRYHWRNDDGSETTATSKTSGTANTDITGIAKLATIRLRVEISNEGGSQSSYAAQQFRIEYGLRSTTCAAIASWTDVGANGGDWDMANSSNLTDGNNTTNIAISAGGVADDNPSFVTSNAAVKDTSSTVTSLSLPSDSFIELEYSIAAQAAATDSGVYCFRVTNAGATTHFTYTSHPQATLSAGSASLTFLMDGSSQLFPALTPGTLVATSSILYVETDNASGFNVTTSRVNALATLLLNTDTAVSIPDKTAWDPGANCASAGNATASTTNPNTFEFRVRQVGTDTGNYCSAWWGTADTTAAALFAGFPTTEKQIANRTTASTPTTTVRVLYNMNVSETQKTGIYTGSITYTVTANP